MTFYEDINNLLRTEQITTKDQLQRAKIRLCKKHRLDTIPQDSDILNHLPDDLLDNDTLLHLLRLKSTRTLSGVAVIAVMTSPADCPHGRCRPCPGGPHTHTPQSYTGDEPAALRALTYHCDPYDQTTSRLRQLHTIGHHTDKIDFIVMGGTFTARTPHYQQWFIQRCYDAMNHTHSKTLRQAQHANETAATRCIGLTIETRPDWLRLHHIDALLSYGATRVELGVQTTDDAILEKMDRGHTVTDSILATRLAKDAGLKVCYHLMPGLPGSTLETDQAMFQTVFTDERFKPDMLKIYPTLVVDGADLADDPAFTPLTTENAVNLLASVKATIPEWIRIQRIQRDIPVQRLHAGIKNSNLRQFVADELRKRGQACYCIRCREIGHQPTPPDNINEEPRLTTRKYNASGGKEHFISLTGSHDVLYGYLRLRMIPDPYRPELAPGPCLIVRELRILGREVPLLGRVTGPAYQHRGLGRQLLAAAEAIAKETYDAQRLYVLSGIGVKPYYRKLGFIDTGTYLAKTLT